MVDTISDVHASNARGSNHSQEITDKTTAPSPSLASTETVVEATNSVQVGHQRLQTPKPQATSNITGFSAPPPPETGNSSKKRY